MFKYQDDDFLFSATSVEASFDANSVVLDSIENMNITVKPGTPMGDEIHLVVLDDDNNVDNSNNYNNNNLDSSSKILRLILIPPEKDWRRNQTYAWKLDNAWMSNPYSKWLHWNIESYVDSVVQVPQANDIFACSVLEFHFSPIGMKRSHYNMPGTRVRFYNVQIGAGLSSAKGNGESTKIYNPCTQSSKNDVNCEVVDGNDSASIYYNRIISGDTTYTDELLIGAGILVVLLVLCSVVACIWKRHCRSKLYERIAPTPEEDLTLQVEDTYQGSGRTPKSTLAGGTNETG